MILKSLFIGFVFIIHSRKNLLCQFRDTTVLLTIHKNLRKGVLQMGY